MASAINNACQKERLFFLGLTADALSCNGLKLHALVVEHTGSPFTRDANHCYDITPQEGINQQSNISVLDHNFVHNVQLLCVALQNVARLERHRNTHSTVAVDLSL